MTDEGIRARCRRLEGAIIELPYPSVGATESALLSAALAEGKTVIRNAATEPEVLELALFLQRMGARVELSPDRRMVIEGVPTLRGAQTRLQGDRNEAFSYLVAGLITGGTVRVIGCGQDRLVTAITTLLAMGAEVKIDEHGISAFAPDGLHAAAVSTDVHPGFMTDWQTPLMVLFTQAEGMSVLHETVYEDRFVYVPALKAMGGEIGLFATCLGGPACRFHDTSYIHSAVVRGPSKLQGTEVDVPDVRAGFSSVIAAAAASGPTMLHGVRHLERGYHRPADQLQLARPPARAAVAARPPGPATPATRRLDGGAGQCPGSSPLPAEWCGPAHGPTVLGPGWSEGRGADRGRRCRCRR